MFGGGGCYYEAILSCTPFSSLFLPFYHLSVCKHFFLMLHSWERGETLFFFLLSSFTYMGFDSKERDFLPLFFFLLLIIYNGMGKGSRPSIDSSRKEEHAGLSDQHWAANRSTD